MASYFADRAGIPARTLRLVQEAVDLEAVACGSEVEALLLENALIKELQPRWNVKLKDGKDYPLVAITREEFPRVFLTRERDLEATDYVGPFGSMTELRRAYHFLQRVFQFRVCDLDIRTGDKAREHFAPCLNFHIKRCSAPCTTRIDAAQYGADIQALRAFLSGRGKAGVVADLETRMKGAARELRFEDAARVRDQLQAIGRLRERGKLSDWRQGEAPVIDLHDGLERLRTHLGLSANPKVIEGFDIAHQGGKHVVASLVRFENGVPHKDGYRRFQIRGGELGPRKRRLRGDARGGVPALPPAAR